MQAGQEPLNKCPTHGTESRDGSGTGGTKDSKGKQGGAKKKGACLQVGTKSSETQDPSCNLLSLVISLPQPAEGGDPLIR